MQELASRRSVSNRCVAQRPRTVSALLSCALSVSASTRAFAQPAPSGDPPAAAPRAGGEAAASEASTGAVSQAAVSPAAVSPAVAASPSSPSLDEKALGLDGIVAVSGGLTAKDAGRRAAETSRGAERLLVSANAKDAEVDRVLWGAAPRFTVEARYTRLSDINNGDLAGGAGDISLVGAQGATPLEPLDPAVTPLIPLPPIQFPVVLNNYHLGARVDVPLSNYIYSLSHTLKGLRRSQEALRMETRAARNSSALNAKLDYYAWVQARLNLLLAERARTQAERRAQDMNNLFASGRVARADVLQAQAFLADTQLAEERARSASLLGERRLRLDMHAGPQESFAIGESILSRPQPGAEQDAEAMYREAIEHRPEVAALQKNRDSLSHAKKVQASAGYPRVEAFGNYDYDNPNQRVFPQEEKFTPSWAVGISLTWSPNDLGTSRAEVAATESQRMQLESQLNELQETLQVQILSAQRELAEARLNIETARQGQQAAQAAYEARELLYHNGRSTSLEILQAETTRINAHLALVGAYVALAVAHVRLDYTLGRPLY